MPREGEPAETILQGASQNAVDLIDMKIRRAEKSIEKYQQRLQRRDSEPLPERIGAQVRLVPLGIAAIAHHFGEPFQR